MKWRFSKEDIKNIFREIVENYPMDGCMGINGFTTVHDSSVFHNTTNSGKIHNDYLEGNFWSRDWVASGADPDKLCLEYPALGFECIEGRYDRKCKKACAKIGIILVGKYDCKDCCKGCDRTKDKVHSDVFEMLVDVWQEFLSYGIYKTDDGFIWATPGMGVGTHPNPKMENLVKDSDSVTITERIMPGQNQVAFSLSFEICGCYEKRKGFDYTERNYKTKGVTKCASC